jgi:choline dehydrogenase-like flavoprotein
MIIDFNDLSDEPSWDSDLCVVGAGAAGFAIAREFFRSSLSVTLLESGGFSPEPETQSLYESQVVGYPHAGIHRGRVRVLGGTTTLWAGQALPLDAIDFKPRQWVPDSGWPFSRDTLEPYYRRAEEVMGLKAHDYTDPVWPRKRASWLNFDRTQFRYLTSQFSPQPNFDIAYRSKVRQARNITLLIHANVTRINVNPNGSAVESVAIASLSGKRAIVRARYFVISSGGIESARILLASNNVQKNGIGNDFDLVGRYFQDHVQGITLPLRNNWPHIRVVHDAVYRKGVARQPKIAFSEEFQEREAVLNATVGITYDGFVPDDDPVEAAKRVIKAVVRRRPSTIRWSDIQNATSSPGPILSAGYRRFVRGRPAFYMSGTPHIGLQCECAPIASSRVTLDTEADALGVPRTRLDWRLSPLVGRTVVSILRKFALELKRLSLADCDVDLIDKTTVDEWGLFDANHHIGTTRMGESPRRGVVNADCRLHGVDNLYVASSAVFPTGGHSNPTLTIIALAIRISDHLKTKLRALQ